jgi:hypothetical protein
VQEREKPALLGGADAEDLGATGRAGSLGGGSAVLHLDGLGSFDFFLGATLYTICLHGTPPMTTLLLG